MGPVTRVKLPRGACSECGATVALRKNGVAREHLRYPGLGLPEKCPGSGKKAAR